MTATQTKKFNHEAYAPIKSSHLVAYAIYDLQSRGVNVSPEDVISACFTLFPKRFSLQKYPQWPDSAMIGRRLHDCRIKRLIAAKTDHEVRLTFKGMRLAERTARALGLTVPVWRSKPKVAVVEAPKPAPMAKVPALVAKRKAKPTAKKKAPIIKASKPVEKVFTPIAKPAPAKSRPTPKKKAPVVEVPKPAEKVSTPVAKAKPTPVKPKAKVPVVETPKQEVKVTRPVSKPKVKSKPIEKVVTPVAKPAPAAKALAPVAKPKPLPVKPKAKVPAVEAPKQKVKAAKPVSKPKVKPKPVVKVVTPVAKPAPAAKALAPVAKPKPLPVKPKAKVPVFEAPKQEVKVAKPVSKPKTKPQKRVDEVKVAGKLQVDKLQVTEAAKPDVQRSTLNVQPVSAEEKARAGKFVKMMESSDAYRLYKKNGANSQISEFDFRSLLLCTMESSPETLARNVELFKGYAGIHNRQDLIVFLVFCRDRFSHLLVPEKKSVRKLK